ncbi:hypothetical protein K3495_g5634 [Podosphaera aphanis]|nr:hypothetical protein K3495_g5634 [Podosphaera aphanis]
MQMRSEVVLAQKEENLALRACKRHLEEAIQVIESLQKTKVSLSKVSQYDRKDENSAIAEILQEIKAQVASKEETSGTVIRIQDDKEKKEIAKLSSEELVKKIGIKEVIGARKMLNGQVKVYFAGEQTKQPMEQETSWTSKLAPSARVASPRYQVLLHDIPLSFQPENAVHLKELQKENQL